ncbi:MAG: translation initiation factor [Helicobacteraceae bacterium]|nr:translation initiation factor [Helicobacteraceae bacterium]
MAKGKKIDLNIGSNMGSGWSEVSEKVLDILKDPTEANKHFLHFKREKRRGKVVTLVGEFNIKKDVATALLKKLKKSLGCGGAYKDNYMEFQGEASQKLKALLVKEGYRFKN